MKRSNFTVFLGLTVLTFCATSCLKTRAQLKHENEEAEKNEKVEKEEREGNYAVDELKGEITRMTGRIEDIERANKEKKPPSVTDDEAFRKAQDRVQELERNQLVMMDAIKKLQGSASTENPAFFEEAKQQYEAGNCEDAIGNLDKYLTAANPKHAEEAFYLRGDCYYQQKHYKKAIVDFSKFPEKYSRSKYMTTALYKIGLSFEAMGMKDDARSFFQELIEKFPKSTEAKRAKLKVKRN